MGSVNATTPSPLPTPQAGSTRLEPAADGGSANWDVADGLSAMGNSVGSVLTDAAGFAGVAKDDKGNLEAGMSLTGVLGAGTVTAGPVALASLANRTNNLTGVTRSYGEAFGANALGGTIRITPTLVSAVAGPAIADGVTMIAPNLVKKRKDLSKITDSAQKKEGEKNNQWARISRAVAGGATVGLAAGVLFLVKPTVFRRFGAGVMRSVEGTTHVRINGGETKALTGVLDAGGARNLLAASRQVSPSDTVEVIKTMGPMARDAVFTNRAIMGSAGALGTLLLADKAAGESDPERRKLMLGATAAAGAMTIGATAGIGKLAARSVAASAESGAASGLAKMDFLMKPNMEWIKKYGSVIAPITAVPAGTAASQYYNIVSDFETITSPRSPFRR
jgi:hypothetical protein